MDYGTLVAFGLGLVLSYLFGCLVGYIQATTNYNASVKRMAGQLMAQRVSDLKPPPLPEDPHG